MSCQRQPGWLRRQLPSSDESKGATAVGGASLGMSVCVCLCLSHITALVYTEVGRSAAAPRYTNGRRCGAGVPDDIDRSGAPLYRAVPHLRFVDERRHSSRRQLKTAFLLTRTLPAYCRGRNVKRRARSEPSINLHDMRELTLCTCPLHMHTSARILHVAQSRIVFWHSSCLDRDTHGPLR